MLCDKIECVRVRHALNCQEWYSLDGTFFNAVNRKKSKQLQNYRKTPFL